MVRILSGIKGTKKAAPKKLVPTPPAKKKTYKAEKEFVIINGTKASTALSKAVPAVRVRVSRGKSYDPNVMIKNNQDVVDAFRKFFTANKVEGQEQMAVMYLGPRLQVIGIYMHTIGGMTAVMVESKLIMATAMQLAAENIITCHNHPSGNLIPSDADHKVAELLTKQCKLFGMRLQDSLIITKSGSRSYT
jgi:DNA repair protein RadC